MDESPLPISALQHLLYCDRQCALIHIERVWQENVQTAEGRVLHAQAHDGPDESRPGVRITRGLAIASQRLGLHGYCDVVEFHRDGAITIVEYKRGRPKQHRADEVQLCAQALCLEEMTSAAIASGTLYYGKTRRRLEVAFDEALRGLTLATIASLRGMLDARRLPPAVYERRKCQACSLIGHCQPQTPASAAAWWRRQTDTARAGAEPEEGLVP